jgi:rSAM/selenodomain-associated transferase 2
MISAIIPTLNAAPHLPRTLASLAAGMTDVLIKEVIVADGGSEDETLAIADAAGCKVVKAERGRAKQLRAGAEAAKGRWLLFLNADTSLATGWVEETERFLKAPQSRQKAAVFKLAFDDASPQARRAVFWARLRARVMGLPYGDQGLLISRFLYDGLGGYPDISRMEDVGIMHRIGRRRLVLLESHAVTSAEKFCREGDGKPVWRELGLWRAT